MAPNTEDHAERSPDRPWSAARTSYPTHGEEGGHGRPRRPVTGDPTNWRAGSSADTSGVILHPAYGPGSEGLRCARRASSVPGRPPASRRT